MLLHVLRRTVPTRAFTVTFRLPGTASVTGSTKSDGAAAAGVTTTSSSVALGTDGTGAVIHHSSQIILLIGGGFCLILLFSQPRLVLSLPSLQKR